MNIILETTQGTIEFELFADIAPKTCENFTTHIKNGYYNGIIFHRIIEEFMIQGGDPTGSGMGGESIWGKPFRRRVRARSRLRQARHPCDGQRRPGTNGSQFFITTVPTPWLHMKHTIFGEVTSGMDVVTKLEQVKKGPGDRPVEEQKIISAKVVD